MKKKNVSFKKKTPTMSEMSGLWKPLSCLKTEEAVFLVYCSVSFSCLCGVLVFHHPEG